MSEVFGSYAAYYDLLYQDKDYAQEASFVDGLIQKHRPGGKSLLELGCGTGTFATWMAKKGYSLHGIDVSEAMLTVAEKRRSDRIGFSKGDVQTFRTQERFDAVLSLFHVVSYQTTNEGLLRTLKTAREHLKPGGLFVFDCWYGPAVLHEGPSARVKRFEGQGLKVTRSSKPVIHPNRNVVDVHFDIRIEEAGSSKVTELQEVHSMRYLFKPELELLFSQAGLDCIEFGEWMTGSEPTLNTWGAYFVLRA